MLLVQCNLIKMIAMPRIHCISESICSSIQQSAKYSGWKSCLQLMTWWPGNQNIPTMIIAPLTSINLTLLGVVIKDSYSALACTADSQPASPSLQAFWTFNNEKYQLDLDRDINTTHPWLSWSVSWEWGMPVYVVASLLNLDCHWLINDARMEMLTSVLTSLLLLHTGHEKQIVLLSLNSNETFTAHLDLQSKDACHLHQLQKVNKKK